MARPQAGVETNQNGKRPPPEAETDDDKENEPKKSKNIMKTKPKNQELEEPSKKSMKENGFEEWNEFRKQKIRWLLKKRKERAKEIGLFYFVLVYLIA